MKIQLSSRSHSPSLSSAQQSLLRLEKLLILPSERTAALNVVFLYEDAETREWAREMHDGVCQIAGTHPVRPTWWKLTNLFEPGVLAAAVSTAMRADVVVIAIRAEEGLPLPFYTWVN